MEKGNSVLKCNFNINNNINLKWNEGSMKKGKGRSGEEDEGIVGKIHKRNIANIYIHTRVKRTK